MTKTKIDGITIRCGSKSLWLPKEAVEDMLNGKVSQRINATVGIDITVTPNVVEVE